MILHEIIILIPSHGLEDFPTDLPDEKSAGLLNAFAVACHPSLLAAVKVLPREHRADEPPTVTAESLVLVPTACQDQLPPEWIDRTRAEGVAVVVGEADRHAWVREVLQAAGLAPPENDSLVGDFFALGTSRLLLELLTRRMHHFGGMDEGRLRREAVAAAEATIASDLEAARAHLRASFEALLEARERFYPVECYLLDLCLLIPRLADQHLARILACPKPVNVLISGSDLADIAKGRPDLVSPLRSALEAGTLDLVGGEFRERPVPLLPLASMLREFELGRDVYHETLGRGPTTWGRRRYGFSTLVPQILHQFGFQGGLHVALDDGLYPDVEQSKIRWEGCDGSVIDATTRIPLAAESAASYLRFPSRMAESMQQDQTAAVILARWPEVAAPFWEDFQRIHHYAPVLGRFVTLRQFFEQTEDPGRLSRFEEREYLSPFLIQAVAAGEPDPIGRFKRHFERRARFDGGVFLDRLSAILCGQPAASPRADEIEARLEATGPDRPADEESAPAALDAEIDVFVDQSVRRLSKIILQGAGNEPGCLVFNPLSFARTAVVELPKTEVAPAAQAPIRGAQVDASHCHIVVALPACGFAWIPRVAPAAERAKGRSMSMAEGTTIRNEFIEVHVNETTGGISRVKQFGRKPNRLSQQLAFRFPRERGPAPADVGAAAGERNFYSQMRCASISVTCRGPGLGEIVTSGTLIDPEDGATVAEYTQTVRVWRGRPVIELHIELRASRLPDGDPWSNYIASRFAWNDSTATLTRGVLGGAHGFGWERFESPHFFEIATETQRTTILPHGRPFHRKTGPRMVDSLLVVGGESARRFQFGIAIDSEYPMRSAMDALMPPMVLETATGPPTAGRSGWLFHLDARNVQILQLLPLKPDSREDGESEPDGTEAAEFGGSFGFGLRLYETEGRQRPVQLRCFRTPTRARRRDFRGRTVSLLKIVDDAVYLEMTGYEIADVELYFGD